MEFKNKKISKTINEDLYAMAKYYEEHNEEDKMIKYYVIASEQKHIDSIKELIKYYINNNNNTELDKYKQLLEDATSKKVFFDGNRKVNLFIKN